MTLSLKETMEAVAKIYQLSSEGVSEHNIAKKMGLDVTVVGALRSQMLEMKTDEIRQKPVEHTYVEYMLNQLVNVHDLTKAIKDLKHTKQYNQTMISAIRARAEIWDKLMAKGQECGVIKKAVERKEIGIVTVLAELSNSELRKEVGESISKLTAMVERHGETDFTKLPVPEVLHTGPVVEDEDKKKKKKKSDKKKKKKKMGKSKSKTSRISKGRVRELPPNPLDKKKGEEDVENT